MIPHVVRTAQEAIVIVAGLLLGGSAFATLTVLLGALADLPLVALLLVGWAALYVVADGARRWSA